jgi:hypothetical protein
VGSTLPKTSLQALLKLRYLATQPAGRRWYVAPHCSSSQCCLELPELSAARVTGPLHRAG